TATPAGTCWASGTPSDRPLPGLGQHHPEPVAEQVTPVPRPVGVEAGEDRVADRVRAGDGGGPPPDPGLEHRADQRVRVRVAELALDLVLGPHRETGEPDDLAEAGRVGQRGRPGRRPAGREPARERLAERPDVAVLLPPP